MKFLSEEEMYRYIEEFFYNSFAQNEISILSQQKGILGIPDYILVKSDNACIEYSIAIEVKLTNWKQALKQAFKYRNFSNESFVIVDEISLQNTIKHIDEFKRYNIGLGSFNKDYELKIVHYPKPSKPFSLHYLNKLYNNIFKLKKDSKNINRDKLLCLDNYNNNELHYKLTEYALRV